MLQPPRPLAVQFVPFDSSRLVASTQAGQPVLIDFTARWCLSCRWVDATIYDSPQTAALLRKHNVLAMRGDVTTADLPANTLLYQELRSAPPLTVLYLPGNQTPIRLEGKFSKADLARALDGSN